jgi:hypothetical protein
VPVAHCPLQISHGPAWDWQWHAAEWICDQCHSPKLQRMTEWEISDLQRNNKPAKEYTLKYCDVN